MASKRPRQAAYHGSDEGFRPAWMQIVGGLVIGAAVAVLLDFRGRLPFFAEELRPSPNPSAVAPPDGDAGLAAESAAPPKPKYDFYTVLPELDQIIPDAELTEQAAAPVPVPADPTEPVAPTGRYFLQAGSFRDSGDAETLKAKLAMTGMRAGVTPVNINGATWFRVRVGPFDNAQALDGAKRQLGADGIQAIALKEAAPQ